MLDYLTFVILVNQAGIERTWTIILRIISIKLIDNSNKTFISTSLYP